jgi:hypothetical protein
VFSFHLSGTEPFYAYYTKVSHTSTDYFGKFADLIVVIGEDRQLEFTRRTQYRPRWVTPDGSFMVDDFYPGRDVDYNLDYNHVRLIENSLEKIIVNWRYFPDIASITKANEYLNPATIDGFTSVVYEIFTIYPDGKVEREVKDARGSRYETWMKKNYGDRQTLQLTDTGIIHGSVKWGNKSGEIAPLINGNPVIKSNEMINPILEWTFDEGTEGFPVELEDEEVSEVADMTYESVTKEFCPVSGHMKVYKKGVSGSALGFDGYYSGVIFEEEKPDIQNSISLEAWIALDVYPFNEAPIIHQSKQFGHSGFYLGVDPYGKLLFRINGQTIKSEQILPLYQWKYITATIENNRAKLYLDGEILGNVIFDGSINIDDVPYIIGLNNELERCTDYVRGFDQNIPFIYGIQGMMDEVRVYDSALTQEQILRHYKNFLPKERTSPLKRAVLPGEVGISQNFGATYKNLEFHELWDKMWRLSDKTDIVVKFDQSPVSVIYWRGTNFAANWVTDNNRWMADQSSEIFTRHGCSEHMSDKQTRHSYARIIENNDARVVVHWRYPCVDVGYYCVDRKNYTDEYHTIYPDATAIRKVVYNNTTTEAPGFQDIQYFTNPGETALDVVELNAVTVANTNGDIFEMIWKKPNKNPQSELKDATIQYMNSKSEWKVYAIYPEPGIGTWGDFEQSKYTDDPFAGPWNHWPISVVPSDGRYAVAHDRVTHFALGAGDAGKDAIVHYGFTNKDIKSLIPIAKYWQNPPAVSNINGGVSEGFNKNEKAYILKYNGEETMSFTINANEDSPLVNPAFVIKNCSSNNVAVNIDQKSVSDGNELRIGQEYDTEGKPQTIVWIQLNRDKEVSIKLENLSGE